MNTKEITSRLNKKSSYLHEMNLFGEELEKILSREDFQKLDSLIEEQDRLIQMPENEKVSENQSEMIFDSVDYFIESQIQLHYIIFGEEEIKCSSELEQNVEEVTDILSKYFDQYTI